MHTLLHCGAVTPCRTEVGGQQHFTAPGYLRSPTWTRVPQNSQRQSRSEITHSCENGIDVQGYGSQGPYFQTGMLSSLRAQDLVITTRTDGNVVLSERLRQRSGDTTPCRMTGVTLHGVDTTPCRMARVTLHGVAPQSFVTPGCPPWTPVQGYLTHKKTHPPRTLS